MIEIILNSCLQFEVFFDINLYKVYINNICDKVMTLCCLVCERTLSSDLSNDVYLLVVRQET